jgi:hypothetical protein
VEVATDEEKEYFEPSVYFDLDRLGDSEVYDETTVDLDEYSTDNGEETPEGDDGGTPGETTDDSPGDEEPEVPENGTKPPAPF